jgi:hypothetical protein
MIKIINRALATAFAVALIFGSGTFALADKGGHSKGHANKNGGNSATAHSCVNPAGNVRGWCKSQMGGAFITGTVASINGSTALVTLSNGQQVTINTGGRNLSVGQQVTLRGSFGTNGVFAPSGGNYNNYGGPYSGASVRGLIISVNGNSIQIAQGLSLITINDSLAASRGAINGTLIPGRTITANGNWSGSTFLASSIQ